MPEKTNPLDVLIALCATPPVTGKQAERLAREAERNYLVQELDLTVYDVGRIYASKYFPAFECLLVHLNTCALYRHDGVTREVYEALKRNPPSGDSYDDDLPTGKRLLSWWGRKEPEGFSRPKAVAQMLERLRELGMLPPKTNK